MNSTFENLSRHFIRSSPDGLKRYMAENGRLYAQERPQRPIEKPKLVILDAQPVETCK